MVEETFGVGSCDGTITLDFKYEQIPCYTALVFNVMISWSNGLVGLKSCWEDGKIAENNFPTDGIQERRFGVGRMCDRAPTFKIDSVGPHHLLPNRYLKWQTPEKSSKHIQNHSFRGRPDRYLICTCFWAENVEEPFYFFHSSLFYLSISKLWAK